jgi:hypothetical protein
LASWHPVDNVLMTNSSVPFVDYPASNALVWFYRVRSPGVTAFQAAAAWQVVRPAHHQYSFQNTKLNAGVIVFLGTVTISNGVKTVTDVTANGIPTTTFDPADFLTPDEVFVIIADVESQGANLAHVTYDEQCSFASAVVIIASTATPMTDYGISGFVDLSGGNGQANRVGGRIALRPPHHRTCGSASGGSWQSLRIEQHSFSATRTRDSAPPFGFIASLRSAMVVLSAKFSPSRVVRPSGVFPGS